MMNSGLRQSGLPLGGLGTGSVELRSDGLFHEWQILNNRPWGGGPELETPENTFFFGLQVHGAKVNRTAVLSRPPAVNPLSHHPYDIPWLEHPSAIESEPLFPFTHLDYELGDFPVGVTLEAFSPFIPLDAKNSGLPLAFLTFNLENRTEEPVRATLFGCLKNLVGYSVSEQLSVVEAELEEGPRHLFFSRENLPENAPDSGSMALGVLGDEGAASYVSHFRPRDLWDPMREAGVLENLDMGSLVEEMGNVGASEVINRRQGQPHGALANTIELPPGEGRRLTFVLAWHFPHLVECEYDAKKTKAQNIGHMYENWFGDAREVLAYGAEHFDHLRSETEAFFEGYFNSSLPKWLLEAIAAQLTTLVKASWWDREGRFGIWEGLGCCGLQTTDITHYASFSIVQFFPEIQKSQMRLSRENAEAKGKIPHLMPGNFSCCDLDVRERIDLIPQFILLLWRDVQWTGDLEYLREMWTTVKDALARFATTDTDGDGLPNNSGPDQTYDQFPLKGTSAFVGFLYLAALKATAELAILMDEPDFAAELLAQAKVASGTLDDQLWNGRYFRLSHDSATGKNNEGVMADQLNADWFYRQSTGEGLVEDIKVKSSLQCILDTCGMPGYLANCVWPEGEGISIGRHTSDQAGFPWSGVEYAVAAHLVLLGMEEAGLHVARQVWDRYERAGLRFNHIECGSHYYRAMSSWAIYLAWGGYVADLLESTLSLRLGKDTQVVLVCPTGWGLFKTVGASAHTTLELKRGFLELKKINITGLSAQDAAVSVNQHPVDTQFVRDAIVFGEQFRLEAGDEMELSLVRRERPIGLGMS